MQVPVLGKSERFFLSYTKGAAETSLLFSLYHVHVRRGLSGQEVSSSKTAESYKARGVGGCDLSPPPFVIMSECITHAPG